ncbi:aminoglycoside phosphotransferase family protein [Pseudoalteromonas luteoviolacea]|uniref:Aminoglycoside phosphotransferase domain-containing protein n=1 Tax=Pseudoalteromonas luteoviolacea NCIMB 1942 TaxID=1365253 RepID=A0A167HE58_9GAMM|nr:phosphotransferase [Pseudoalteromonas luteoviolacea]KZN58023.1 hypothetical protein N482_22830 [Pseudoalteromonas luteoviolacea NCIMB 1942]KZW99933.1 hypothetical protein JL49_14290 [Pseudoalteromonas luteoviolacea]
MTRLNSDEIVQRSQDRLKFIELYLTQQENTPEQLKFEAITGDASFRLYFRVVVGQERYILMDVTPEKGSVVPFVKLNENFKKNGLAVPEIHAFNEKLGFVLLEDLGSTHLADLIDHQFDKRKYRELISWLPKIAQVKASPWMNPYDAEFIQQETNIFRLWLLESWLGVTLFEEMSMQWTELNAKLTEQMLAQPQTVMHRDFHSRNVMYSENAGRLIDYQDAVMGPVCYDAVSLLKDCYIRLPQTEFLELRSESYQQLFKAGLLGDMTFDQYVYHFDLTGLQRHLKAAGIFVRLHLRDGKAGYLQSIIPTLEYVVEVGNRYSEFQWLATWLQSEIIPLIQVKLQS